MAETWPTYLYSHPGQLLFQWTIGPAIDFEDCLLIGIAQTTDFGDHLLIGIV